MPSNHLIFCCLLLLLPSIFPSIRIFSNQLALCISIKRKSCSFLNGAKKKKKKNPSNKQTKAAKKASQVLPQNVAFKQQVQQFSKKLMATNSVFHLKIEYYGHCFQHLCQMVSEEEIVPVSTSPSLNSRIQVTDGSGSVAPCSKGSENRPLCPPETCH